MDTIHRLVEGLDSLIDGRPHWVKARDLSVMLGLSPKEIGQGLSYLAQNPVGGLRVQFWSCTKAATWKIWQEP